LTLRAAAADYADVILMYASIIDAAAIHIEYHCRWLFITPLITSLHYIIDTLLSLLAFTAIISPLFRHITHIASPLTFVISYAIVIITTPLR